MWAAKSGRRTVSWRAGARLVLAAALLGCGARVAEPRPPQLPATLVLRIDTVDVELPSDRAGWDGAAPDGDPGAGCEVVVAGLSIWEPVLSPAAALCGLATGQQLERRPEAPDLFVRLGAGADVAYSSWVHRDTFSQSLQYEFVVPVSAVPADGLRLEVLDDDGGGPNELNQLVGGMRLSREALTRAYQSPSRMVTLSGGSVRSLQVVVSPYTDEPPVRRSRSASDGPVVVGRRVIAGEVVTVRAAGDFVVGSWYDRRIEPSGYPGGGGRSYNLQSFREEPHACAIAMIGSGSTVEGVAVRAERTFVAGHAGSMRVGLNDRDLSNNEGQVVFDVARRAPTVEEWRARGGMR
jgi:hypothetical protein